MAYRLNPALSLTEETRQVAIECIEDALQRLDALADATSEQIEGEVHEVRKRCKEARAVARLVRRSLGDGYDRFNEATRDAAREFSSVRDAQVMLDTVETLRGKASKKEARRLDVIRARHREAAHDATDEMQGGDERIRRARALLEKAAANAATWEVPDGFVGVEGGLRTTYRKGRKALKTVEKKPTDENVHEWRKRVKYLWYQVRLLEEAAPDTLGPLVEDLDDLSDDLGDDHDMAVLVEQLEAERTALGDDKAVDTAITLARARQAKKRSSAFDLGDKLYDSSPAEMVAGMGQLWTSAAIERRAPHG